jgi:hypothetical protein
MPKLPHSDALPTVSEQPPSGFENFVIEGGRALPKPTLALRMDSAKLLTANSCGFLQ